MRIPDILNRIAIFQLLSVPPLKIFLFPFVQYSISNLSG